MATMSEKDLRHLLEDSDLSSDESSIGGNSLISVTSNGSASAIPSSVSGIPSTISALPSIESEQLEHQHRQDFIHLEDARNFSEKQQSGQNQSSKSKSKHAKHRKLMKLMEIPAETLAIIADNVRTKMGLDEVIIISMAINYFISLL